EDDLNALEQTDHRARADEDRTQNGDTRSEARELGRALSTTIQDEQLVLETHGFDDDRAGAAGTGESGNHEFGIRHEQGSQHGKTFPARRSATTTPNSRSPCYLRGILNRALSSRGLLVMLHSNAALIQRLFAALNAHDAEAMAACYHSRNVRFRDIAF